MKTTEELYNKGIAAVESGDLKRAARLFADVLSQNPKHEGAWVALGRCVDDPERAKYCLETALSLNPGNEVALQLLDKLSRADKAQKPFLTDELLEAWDEEYDRDKNQEGLPDKWGGGVFLPEEETPGEKPAAPWEVEEEQQPESDRETFFTEDELSGAWDEGEEFDLPGDSEEETPAPWDGEVTLPGEKTTGEDAATPWEIEEEQQPESDREAFFTEDELSGAWDESEEFDLPGDSEEEMPETWGSEVTLPGEETTEEAPAAPWEIEEEEPQPEGGRESLFTEDELSGAWDESEESSPAWDTGDDLPDDWGSESELPAEEREQAEFSTGWEGKEETSYDWGDAGQEGGASKNDSLRSRLDAGKTQTNKKTTDIWDASDTILKKVDRDDQRAKSSSKKRSCFSRILSTLFGLILILLLAVVAFLAVVDPNNPPEIIEPYFRMFIPAPTATIAKPTATENISTRAPAKLPPTWTLSPSPIPSKTSIPSPTLSPTPTATPTAAQIEGEIIITTDESGWSRYRYPEKGFAISVPPEWVYLDLSAEDYEAMLSEIDQDNPALAGAFTVEEIQTLVGNGVKFLAVDGAITAAGALTNLNIITSDLEAVVDFDAYVAANIVGLEEAFGEELQVAEERTSLGMTEAAKLTYQVTMSEDGAEPQDLNYIQYLMLQGEKEYILTFTVPSEALNAEQVDVSEIIGSFELLE